MPIARGKTAWNAAGRRGFTLVELLLVLALLVVVAALAAPGLSGPWSGQRLRDAAGTVRNEVAQARLAALRSGVPHGVWLEPGGGWLRVAPLDDTAGDAAPALGEFLGGPSAGAAAPAHDETLRGPERHCRRAAAALPEGLVFASLEQQAFTADRDQLALPATAVGPGPLEERPLGELALVWQPDGSAAGDAHLRVSGPRGRSLVVHVRGLTGGLSLGGIEVAEALP